MSKRPRRIERSRDVDDELDREAFTQEMADAINRVRNRYGARDAEALECVRSLEWEVEPGTWRTIEEVVKDE